jgi:hypothetical protein
MKLCEVWCWGRGLKITKHLLETPPAETFFFQLTKFRRQVDLPRIGTIFMPLGSESRASNLEP